MEPMGVISKYTYLKPGFVTLIDTKWSQERAISEYTYLPWRLA